MATPNSTARSHATVLMTQRSMLIVTDKHDLKHAVISIYRNLLFTNPIIVSIDHTSQNIRENLRKKSSEFF